MEPNLSARRKRKLNSADESGFTMIEMVVAIPIVFLILGLVFTSVGITVSLMGQVSKNAGAAKVANTAVDRLSAARNCAEVQSVVNAMKSTTYNDDYIFSLSGTCTESTYFPLSLELKSIEDNRVYYSKTMTLAVSA